MSVIAELTIPTDAFELGKILCIETSTRIALDTILPLGGRPTPFVRITNSARKRFEQKVKEHRSVTQLHVVNTHNGETLYAVEWNPSEDSLIRTLRELDSTLLNGVGHGGNWQFECRFPTHDTLATFQKYCSERNIRMTVTMLYNPTQPDSGSWYGLTSPQRETLAYAVTSGYYAVPREVSTKAVAAEFGISDQAVTERLRRGIETLVSNTLLAENVERE